LFLRLLKQYSRIKHEEENNLRLAAAYQGLAASASMSKDGGKFIESLMNPIPYPDDSKRERERSRKAVNTKSGASGGGPSPNVMARMGFGYLPPRKSGEENSN
jgi:hypothetical protein